MSSKLSTWQRRRYSGDCLRWGDGLKDIENLKPYSDYLEGIITGRAIYEGTLDIAAAQALLDSQQALLDS